MEPNIFSLLFQSPFGALPTTSAPSLNTPTFGLSMPGLTNGNNANPATPGVMPSTTVRWNQNIDSSQMGQPQVPQGQMQGQPQVSQVPQIPPVSAGPAQDRIGALTSLLQAANQFQPRQTESNRNNVSMFTSATDPSRPFFSSPADVAANLAAGRTTNTIRSGQGDYNAYRNSGRPLSRLLN